MEPWKRKEVIGDCVLLQGDCRDILPTLPKVDAVVTDAPYLDMKGGTVVKKCFGGGVAPRNVDCRTVGKEFGNADALWMFREIATKGAICFCSYHWIDKCVEMLGGERRGLVTWFKRNSMPSVQNSPHFLTEYAWAVQYGTGINWRRLRTHFDEPMLQAGCMARERICEGGTAVHSCQKPIALMVQMILPGMDSICDPYMGLGTTGVACVQLGRSFIGIEREQNYFDIACRRIRRAYEDQSLLTEIERPKETQPDLFRESA